MGLGTWIQDRREALKVSVVQRVVDKVFGTLDAAGAKRWPVGWIRVRRAVAGWKTILGAVLFYAPEIMEGADKYAPGILSALGMDDSHVQAFTKGIGSMLVVIGLADKYLKFTKPIERRTTRFVPTDGGGLVSVAPLGVQPAGLKLPAPLELSAVDRVAYDSVFDADVRKGKTLEVARAAAEAAVTKNPHPQS